MKRLILVFLFCVPAFAGFIGRKGGFYKPPNSTPPPVSIVTNGLQFQKDATKGNGTGFPGAGCGTTTWTDLISSGLNGTISNCATGWQGAGTSASPYALSFQSASSVYVSGTNNISTSADISLDFWVYFNALTPATFPRLLEIQDASNGVQLIFDSSEYGWVTKDTEFQSSTTASAWGMPAVGYWTNVASVYHTGTTSTDFYLNGVAQTNPISAQAGPGNQASKFYIGVRSDLLSSTFLSGQINEALVYNRALSSAEILQNCNALKSRFSGMSCGVNAGYSPASDPNAFAVFESDTNVTNSGGLATQWVDETGTFTATAASGHQPTIVSNALNGRQVLQFVPGDPDGFTLPAHTSLFPEVGTPWTFTIVTKATAPGSGSFGNIFTSYNSAGDDIFFMLFSNNVSYTVGLIWADGTQYTDNTGAGFGGAFTFDSSNYHVYQASYNGGGTGGALTKGNFYFSVDGVNQTASNSGPFGSDAGTQTIGLGSNQRPGTPYGNPIQAYVAGLYVIKGPKPQSLNSYLNNKWGTSLPN